MCTLDFGHVHVGGSYGLVCLLCALGIGVKLARLAVLLAPELCDFLLARVDAQRGEVHRVGTHIGDASVFIQVLCHHHGLRHGESQFAGSLLLQGRGGEWRCWRALERFFCHAADGEVGFLAFVQKRLHLVVGGETLVQFGLHFCHRPIFCAYAKNGIHTVIRFAFKPLYFSFPFHNQSHGNALHATCRQGRFHLAPQHGRELEAH